MDDSGVGMLDRALAPLDEAGADPMAHQFRRGGQADRPGADDGDCNGDG